MLKALLRRFASLQLFFLLSFLLIGAMVPGTLIPQNQDPETYRKMFSPMLFNALSAVGAFDLFHTPWFIALLALLGVNTTACIAMRVAERKFKRLPWGALASHAGTLTILIGGVVSGLGGEKGTLALTVGEAACCVPAGGSKTLHLPFQVRLADFDVEFYNSGQHYLRIADARQGWTETVAVEPGREYRLREHVRVKVLAYLPDFRMGKEPKSGKPLAYSASEQPANPALNIELTASPTRRLWLFANYPEFSHGADAAHPDLHVEYAFVPAKVKQFRSRVEVIPSGEGENKPVLARGELAVNHPFRYGGYTFYQSGYDPQNPNFSSLQVAKDPGVPLVYAGFLLLPLGLTISFYGKNGRASA